MKILVNYNTTPYYQQRLNLDYQKARDALLASGITNKELEALQLPRRITQKRLRKNVVIKSKELEAISIK